MRRAAYFLLLLFIFAGCGAAPSNVNRIIVQSHDRSQDYILLFVRPKELLVSPVIIPDPPDDSLITHASAIEFAGIERVFYRRGRLFRDAVPGMIWGGPLAAIAAFLPHGIYGSEPYYASAVAAGIAAGGALSYSLGGDDKEFDPSKFADYIALSKLALYRYDEPPELQKIK